MTALSGGVGPLPAGQQRAALVSEVAAALQHLRQGATAVVACSGGPDSTALTHLAAEARPDLNLVIVHVRHGLRSDREDVRLVRQHADWLGLPVEIVDVEVNQDGHGLEAAARDARYAALREVAANRDAAGILVGHTADDQAETVLLRLARGTGIDGLGAMEAVAGDLLRPMLRIRRVDVQRFVLLEGLPVADDPMNEDPKVRRSIVRHELLGVLERVAPDPVGALARLADLARDDRALLDQLAEAHHDSIRRIGPVRIIADAVLEELPLALARRVIRYAMADIVTNPPDAETVQRILALPSGSAVSLPGPIEVSAAAGWRAIAPRSLAPSPTTPLAVPGVAVWAAAGVTVQAITAQTDPWRNRTTAGELEGQVALSLPDAWSPPPPADDATHLPPGGRRERMVLTLPSGVGPFVVRHRKSGDRVTAAGGTRTLQDVFVDAGVPRAVREIWPVVATTDGRVVWVPGIVADEALLRDGRATPAAQLRLSVARAPTG